MTRNKRTSNEATEKALDYSGTEYVVPGRACLFVKRYCLINALGIAVSRSR